MDDTQSTRPQAFGPYRTIVRAGDLYFISGQVGVNPATKTAPSDISGQTRQVLENMRSVLESACLIMDDVQKTTIFLRNINDFETVNQIYCEYFGEPRPARSCVEVARLPSVAKDNELLVEIEAVAYKHQAVM